jgi:hypothetical protein
MGAVRHALISLAVVLRKNALEKPQRFNLVLLEPSTQGKCLEGGHRTFTKLFKATPHLGASRIMPKFKSSKDRLPCKLFPSSV